MIRGGPRRTALHLFGPRRAPTRGAPTGWGTAVGNGWAGGCLNCFSPVAKGPKGGISNGRIMGFGDGLQFGLAGKGGWAGRHVRGRGGRFGTAGMRPCLGGDRTLGGKAQERNVKRRCSRGSRMPATPIAMSHRSHRSSFRITSMSDLISCISVFSSDWTDCISAFSSERTDCTSALTDCISVFQFGADGLYFRFDGLYFRFDCLYVRFCRQVLVGAFDACDPFRFGCHGGLASVLRLRGNRWRGGFR